MLTDLKYAARMLLKAPGFTMVAVLTLALGIGASTAIFSVVNGVLLRPLDYPEPDRVVAVKETQLPEFPEFSASAPNFLDWQQQAKSFSYLAAFTGAPLNLTNKGEPQRLIGLKVTAHYFDVFPVQPALGRALLPEEDAPGKDHVVMLSHALWQRVFDGAADVIGQHLELSGETYTVVGVAPAGYGFGSANKVEAWVPMAFRADQTSNDSRSAHNLNVAGRLRSDTTVAAADTELKLIAAQLAHQYPETNKGWSTFVMPLLDYMVSDVRTVLYTLLGAVGCVLLIACGNIANLLLARATARQSELSIRAALGASRGRLVRQLLTESLLLGLLGGVAGLVLAYWSVEGLIAVAPAGLSRASEIRVDHTVLLVCAALSISTSLAFGLAPAWLAGRTEITDALKQGSRSATRGRNGGRLRGALVVMEVAFAVILLGGAGLLARSFARMTQVDPGFTPDNAAVVRLTLSEKKYPLPEQQVAFANALVSRLRALPGVQGAGIAQPFPLLQGWVFTFAVDGRPTVAPSQMPSTGYYAATSDYFRAIGTRLIRGRVFTDEDAANAPRVAVINETLARQHFPGEEPIGRRINITNDREGWREIIGIVADVKQDGLDQDTSSQVYEPFAQSPYRFLNVVIRTAGSPTALLGSLRSEVYAIDKDQPVGSIRLLKEMLGDSIGARRFAMLLLVVLALVALVIAAVGIYGVTAYTVMRRTGEFGIRMAVGAQRGDVLRLVLWDGGKLICAGLLLGVGTTLAGSRLVGSMLFQTSSRDPLTLGAVTLLLGAVALVACLIPALRAIKVSPMEALRAD